MNDDHKKSMTHVQAERYQDVFEILQNDPNFSNKSLNSQNSRLPLIHMVSEKMKSDDNTTRELVEVMNYDYEEGVTLRSLVDMSTRRCIKVERLDAYPTPLAEEELEIAVNLAKEQVETVQMFYEKYGHSVSYYAMSPVIADRQSPLFGKRIVHLVFLRQISVEQSTRVEVDINLTDGVATLAWSSPESRNYQVQENEVLEFPTQEPEEFQVQGTEVLEHFFPTNAEEDQRQTGWRIEFGVEKHAGIYTKVLYIKKAEFKRGPEEDWFQVLGDCRLAEMFVPYNDGETRYYDVVGFTFELLKLTPANLSPSGIVPGKIFNDRVAMEILDNHVLWMDTNNRSRRSEMDTNNRSRRSEAVHLWAVMGAGNYAYIMNYVFRDDGSIGFYVGATAHNLKSDIQDTSTHLHYGCWRLNVVLGDANKTEIKHVRYISNPQLGAKAKTMAETFNGGQEGGIKWNPEEFTQLLVQSTEFTNNHNPSNPIGYLLQPTRIGNGRSYGVKEEWTHNDFWVTLPNSPEGYTQWKFNDLPSYVRSPRSIQDTAKVIWYQSALIHRPRDEDFGQEGYDSGAGSALTAWTGFVLKPRNFLSSTPLYP